MKYVMIYENSPTGLEKAKLFFPEHRKRLEEFHARGVLLMSGPLLNPTDIALGVFTSREAAEEFIAGDPFVQNGVVAKWSIREWREVLVPERVPEST
ncbi:MAG TPA: YciI family protein [Bacteroidota bacterium]|nr:YciI family protein [Bacteroidota bacterium]